MRNRPVTCLYFALKIPLSCFSLWASFLLLSSAIHDATSFAKMVLLVTSGLVGAIVFGQVAASLFNDVRNIAHGLPLPMVFWYAETNHGDTINEVKANICEEPVEYLAVFTVMGLKLIEITNFHPGHVIGGKLTSQIYEEHPSVITVHNHPGHGDLPFSPTDVYSAMRRGESRSIVVTRSSIYELFLPRRYSCKEAARARDLIENAEGLFPTRARQIRACERVAAEFGMTFKQSARCK